MSLGVGRPRLLDDRVDEAEIDPGMVRQFDQRLQVLGSLVARFVTDDELEPRIVQLRQQRDRMLDALAGHHPGRLQHEDVVGGDSDLIAKVGRELIGLRRRLLEVEHVGNQDRRAASSPRKFLLGERVDGHVLNGRQARRKRHLQKITHRIDGKPVPLPIEIVVMGDHGEFRLGNEMRQGDAQRDVHRQTERVLGNEDVDRELLHEIVQGPFEELGQFVDSPGQIGRASQRSERLLADRKNLRMAEVGFRNLHADGRIAVELAGIPVADVAVIPKDLCPLGALERHAVGTGKPCRNKPNVLWLHL